MVGDGSPWHPVADNFFGSVLMHRFAQAVGLPKIFAYGVVLRVWQNAKVSAPDGDLSTVPDELVSEWIAGLAFPEAIVKAIRDVLCHPDGRIRGWQAWVTEPHDNLELARAVHRERNARYQREFRERERARNADVSLTPEEGKTDISSYGKAGKTDKNRIDKNREEEKEQTHTHARAREAVYLIAVANYVFGYWKMRHKEPEAQYDGGRERIILARLREQNGSPRLLFFAIDGALKDPHAMGDLPNAQRKFNQIEVIFADCARVERHAKMGGWRSGRVHPQESKIPPLTEVFDGSVPDAQRRPRQPVSGVVPNGPAGGHPRGEQGRDGERPMRDLQPVDRPRLPTPPPSAAPVSGERPPAVPVERRHEPH